MMAVSANRLELLQIAEHRLGNGSHPRREPGLADQARLGSFASNRRHDHAAARKR